MGVTLITGASSGIGEALAVELARRGHRVGLIARREDPLRAVVQRIREAGGTAACAPADVLQRAALEQAVRALEAELGPCELLVANAGGDVRSKTSDARIEDWLAVMRLNYDGVVNSVGAVLPGMIQRRRGHLAVVSSLAALRGLPQAGPYSASKAAVSTLFESLRLDLRRFGISVSIIHPGFVATPLTAKNRFAMPLLMPVERAVKIMARGLERRRRRIDFPLPTRLAMGFARLLPGAVFDPLMRLFGPRIEG